MQDREHTGQQESLFEPDQQTGHPVVKPAPLSTRGRSECFAKCPDCGKLHRHIGTGVRRAPCGAKYELQAKGKAA